MRPSPGWTANWEKIHVFNDNNTLVHLQSDEEDFQTLWNNRATGVRVIKPPQTLPGLHHRESSTWDTKAATTEAKAETSYRPGPVIRLLDQHKEGTPKEDPDSTAATIPATLWPHQERFRQQHVDPAVPVRRDSSRMRSVSGRLYRPGLS